MDVEMLDGLLTRHQDSLMVLAAPPHPDTRERVSPRLVSRIIRTLRETFDYVVIDMAPAFDEQVLTALDETDEVVLVATLDVPTLKNVKVAVETFDALHIAKDNRHLVLNRADDEVGINADKVEGILGMTVATQIVSSVDVAAATNAGSPIVVSDPEHQLSVAVRELATRLAGQMVGRPGSVDEDKAEGSTPGQGRRRHQGSTQETEQVMNLADRLAAARAAGMTQDEAERAAALLTDDEREPGEGLPEVDHEVPAPAVPRRLGDGRGQRRRRQAPRRRPRRRQRANGERHDERRRRDVGQRRGRRRLDGGLDVRPPPERRHDQRADGQPGHLGPARGQRAERPDRGAQEQRPRPAAAADGPASLRLGHGPERARLRGPQGPRRRARRPGPAAEQQRPGPGHPGDQRRHPGLRADRAVPARPGRLRGHGQQREPRSTSRRAAG